jgi:secreted trypsin-like serine protease
MTTIKLSLITLAAIAIFATTGCAATTDDDESKAVGEEEVEASGAAIVGGQATSAYPAVGALTQSGSPFCTGTVVAKRVVVTAAHCLAGMSASRIRFAFGPNGFSPQASVGVSRAVVHPQYDANRIKNDIGVLILSSDAPVTPVGINTAMTTSWQGRSLVFVGYGVSNGVTQSGGGTKRVVSIPISEVGSTQFAYEDSRRNTCFGDSGGPAFTQDASGNLLLAGVTSYGDQRCQQYGVDTRVDAFRSFITSASQ